VPWIQADSARGALAALAAAFFGNPSEDLALVGITGTNGKTTTSYVLASIFEAAGVKCGRVGTIGYRIGARELDAPRTTPEAPDVQQMLREMLQESCGACVMEVSSHALALRRVDNLRFAAGIFTNLTRDHLDFHGDMESYFAAKRRLFEILPDGAVGVINADDRRAPDLVAAARRTVIYAIAAPPTSAPDRSRSRSTACRSKCADAARHVPRCGRGWSAGPTRHNISRRRPPRWRSTSRSRRSRPASAASRRCRAASRSFRIRPTTCASSSTTRIPTMR
jgi:UDP-N-acetylmuramoyl-L-alanyl-D-glutamate--2,6-diaminopimelate ligase